MINMVSETVKKFSCLKCGTTFTAYPPDDFHQSAALKHYELEEPIKIEYKCEKCGNVNVLYWGCVSLAFG